MRPSKRGAGITFADFNRLLGDGMGPCVSVQLLAADRLKRGLLDKAGDWLMTD